MRIRDIKDVYCLIPVIKKYNLSIILKGVKVIIKYKCRPLNSNSNRMSFYCFNNNNEKHKLIPSLEDFLFKFRDDITNTGSLQKIYTTTFMWFVLYIKKNKLSVIFYKRNVVLVNEDYRTIPLLHENKVEIKYTLSYRGVYRRYIKTEDKKFVLIDTLQLNKNEMVRLIRTYEFEFNKTVEIFE